MKTLITTPEQRASIMNAIVNGITDKIVYLKGRWSDEKEYEDFNEYKNALTTELVKHLPKDAKILKISKSFTVLLQIPNFPYTPEIYCSMSTLGWRSKK